MTESETKNSVNLENFVIPLIPSKIGDGSFGRLRQPYIYAASFAAGSATATVCNSGDSFSVLRKRFIAGERTRPAL